MAATAGDLIGRLFFARIVAHKSHLLTTLLGQHKALEAYYDGITDLGDSFAEKYMGKYGRPADIQLTWGEPDGDMQDFIKSTVDWIESVRFIVVPRSDTYLQNLIDEIVALHYETLYLLTLN